MRTRSRLPKPSHIRRWSRPPGPAATPTGAGCWPPSAIRRPDRPGAHRHPLRRTRHLPQWCRATEFDEAAAHAYIAQPEFSITIQLHQGAGSCIFWTTDLTHEYVSINADYST